MNSYAEKADLIVIKDANQHTIVGSKTYYLEDTTGTLSIEEVLSPEMQTRFHLQEKDVFSRPATTSAFWFRLQVENHCPEDVWLEIGSTYAWLIDFYAPDDSGQYGNAYLTGTMRPCENKLYDINLFWLPLNKANDTMSKVYYIRIESGLTYELPLTVGTIRSLSKNKDIYDYLTAGFIGLMLIMLLYNSFIYLSTRDHIYAFYLGYLLLMLISMPYANNYPFVQKIEFLWFDKAWWNNNFLLWHPLVYFFIGVFCIRYLNLKENGKRIRLVILGEIAVISGVYPILTLIGFSFAELVNTFQILILIFYITCLITGYYYALRRITQAYFYVIGWTFMVAGVFVFFSVINGILPFNPISRNALYFGTAIEVWMFSLALGNRLNILRQEKNRIQLENLKLIHQQRTKLEKLVKERTRELELQNEKLARSNEELKVTGEKLDSQSQILQELNSNKDRMLAMISHDLKSPLITLKNLIGLADEQFLKPDRYAKISTKLRNDVESLHFSLNNLLQWAISQMEGVEPRKQMISLSPLADENIYLLKEFANAKGIKISNRIKKNVEVYADPELIHLVFRNLMNNALKYTEPGGEIRIESALKENEYHISISDTGVGISPDILQSLFSPKPTYSMFGTQGEKGTGMGLMLCQEFIEKNGGKIWADSKVGEGSTFCFTIPAK